MSSGKGRRAAHHEEEHENHERWAVSYADMVTVLMCLFIVLFAVSQVDQQKYIQLATGLANGFGTSSTTPLSGGEGLIDTTQGKPNPAQLNVSAAPAPVNVNVNSNADRQEKERSRQVAQLNLKLAAKELDRLVEIQKSLESALKAKGLSDRVRFRITERGLVAAVVSDDVFFADASAVIQPKGMQVLATLAPELAKLSEHISVEGNTNHLPVVPGGRYADNWELSAARAAAVVSVFVNKDHMQPDRMIVTGYGQTRPLYPVNDPRAIVGNRRVDIVVIDSQPNSVRSLIPQLAKSRGIDTTDSTTSTTESQSSTAEASTTTTSHD